jgi:hypothetical protein
MLELILSILAAIRVFLRSRGDTALEVLALRQQVAVLKCKRPCPRLNGLDRLFWSTSRESRYRVRRSGDHLWGSNKECGVYVVRLDVENVKYMDRGKGTTK